MFIFSSSAYVLFVLSRNSRDLTFLASLVTPAQEVLVKVAWGEKGIADQTFPRGLIAGGMSNGVVNLWNADAILRGQPPRAAQVTRAQTSGEITALKFHPKEANLLASSSKNDVR